MRIGVVLPIAEEDGDEGAVVRRDPRHRGRRRGAGLDSVWVFDHVLFGFDGVTTGIHECWTMLSAIAEATSRVELGTLVMCTGVPQRGAAREDGGDARPHQRRPADPRRRPGWHDPEYEAFGWPTDHKVSRFEESLAVITRPDPRGPSRPRRHVRDGARRRRWGHRLAPTCRSWWRQDAAHARADRAPRRCLEPGLVRPARTSGWSASRRADGGVHARRPRPATLAITVGITVRYEGARPTPRARR